MQTHRRYDIKTCSWLLKGSFKFLHHASIKVKDIGIPQRLFTRRHVKPVLYLCLDFIWIYSFSTCAKFQKTNISYPLIRTRTCAYQEVKNISFREILCSYWMNDPFTEFDLHSRDLLLAKMLVRIKLNGFFILLN